MQTLPEGQCHLDPPLCACAKPLPREGVQKAVTKLQLVFNERLGSPVRSIPAQPAASICLAPGRHKGTGSCCSRAAQIHGADTSTQVRTGGCTFHICFTAPLTPANDLGLTRHHRPQTFVLRRDAAAVETPLHDGRHLQMCLTLTANEAGCYARVQGHRESLS